MPLLDGTLGFAVRKDHPGAVTAAEYFRDPNDTVSGVARKYYTGTPMELSSGNATKRATTSGGYVTSAKLLGLVAVADSRDPDMGIQFAQMPQVPDQYGRDYIGIYPAVTGNIFTGNLASGIVSQPGLVGISCTLKEQITDQFVVDTTASGIAQLILVMALDPADIGLAGGRVDFIVLGAKSSYLLGP